MMTEPGAGSEREPKGKEVLAQVQSLLTTEGIPELELRNIRHTVALAETELVQEGQLSDDTIEILNDAYKEYRPRTEAELKSEIDTAVNLLKSELERMEYMEDTISDTTANFRELLELMLTRDKLRYPKDIVQAFIKKYYGG